MSPAEFYGAAMAYCMLLGGSQTSGGRTTRHNKAVGGVAQSAHRYWRAMDVEYDDPVNETTAVITGERLGLRVIRETDHDHLQPLDWPKG